MRYVIPALLFCLATPTTAQERILTPETAEGIDAMIRAEGLTHIALGRTEWGFARDLYLKTKNPPHLSL